MEMFLDDIVLVGEQIEKYGLRVPMVDLGGQPHPSIVDFDLTPKAERWKDRLIELSGRPFDHIDPSYSIIDLQGEPSALDALAAKHDSSFGTVVCVGVVQKCENPQGIFNALYRIMRPGGLLIITTVFSCPYSRGSQNYWRYSPAGLQLLAQRSGFCILESDWRLQINVAAAISKSGSRVEQEIRSLYITLAKGDLKACSSHSVVTPEVLKGCSFATTPGLDGRVCSKESVLPRVGVLKRKKRCLFVNTYYPAFLDRFYRINPKVSQLRYEQQLLALQSVYFGDSDFYSKALRESGWEADDVIVNCQPLQTAWTRANDSGATGPEILLEQVKSFKPDVLYCQDMHFMSREILLRLKPLIGLLVGQIASPANNLPIELYDIIISSFPHFVDQFRAIGKTSYYQPLAFDSRVLERIEVLPIASRPIQCSFVGSVSSSHRNRLQFLNHVATRVPLEIWGVGIDELSADSSLRQRYRGQAWGLDMFTVLASSKITINNHIDAASRFSNNMRLFEATGCGALLITDYKDNLNELFQIGKEVVAYRSAEECCALVQYYLSHLDEAEEIARAGQARTLAEHSYNRRMAHSAEVLNRHILYCSTNWQKPDLDRVSSNYVPLGSEMVTSTLADSWQDQSIPEKQRNLVQAELGAMYSGQVPIVFKVLTQALQPYLGNGTKLLEVGCSSGYYYEIIEYLLNKRINYAGVDYSEAMIKLAREFYPGVTFQVADGADMPIVDRAYDVVISSCVILHTPNYVEHIRETIRVADRVVVVHRTPISRHRPTEYFKKEAYGVETVELRFNEQELLTHFINGGLELRGQFEVEADHQKDSYCVTYVFERSRG